MPTRLRPLTGAELFGAMAYCAVCGAKVELCPAPHYFNAPQPMGKWGNDSKPPPQFSDGKRMIVACLYFRDPFHNPGMPFASFCSAACSLASQGGPNG